MSLQANAGVALDWSLGLKNEYGKYLTAESFAFKLACSAKEMKKKQIWFLEQEADQEFVFIKSHLGNYLYINGDGILKCDKDEKSEEAQLVIDAQDDGKWAIRSNKYGWYFMSPEATERNAFEKEVTSSHKWTVNLAMHPQVCLKNVNRSTYMHLADDKQSFLTDEIIPWGDDATITLHFFDEDGSYGLRGANGSFLSASGSLMDAADDSCKFSLVFDGGYVSFKASAGGKFSGKFLTGLGSKGTAKVSKSKITSDEKFHMEDSFPQVKLTSNNGKKVSIKQSVELAASQTETTDNEIFQIEPCGNDKWTIKSCKSKFWTLVDQHVHATADNADSDDSKFTIEWHGPQIALKASNGKYVAQQNNGFLAAKGDSANEESKAVYTYEMVNRPRLVLRGEHGFINTLPSGLLECNKSHPEVYNMHITKGYCKISAGDKYWKAGANGVSAAGSEPELYTMSLHENSKMCLMHEGKYLRGTQNGALMMDGSGPQKETLFEY